jgi:hypothetical protein
VGALTPITKKRPLLRVGIILQYGPVVLAALVGAMRLPKLMDIYISDHYFVVSRRSLITVILVLFVLPLVVATVRQLRSALR